MLDVLDLTAADNRPEPARTIDDEPIAVGAKTTLAEGWINGPNYSAAPSPMIVFIYALANADQLAAVGIDDPTKVTFLVKRVEPDHVGLYASVTPLDDDAADNNFQNMEFVRID